MSILKKSVAKPKTPTSRTITALAFVVPLFLISLLVFATADNPGVVTIAVMCGSLCITLVLLMLVILLFGDLRHKKGFMNFFIGDEGGYSLSRVQAVAWAVVIIAYQVGVILILLNTDLPGAFQYYQLTFSESTLWLLGLSFSSYILVKGITVNKTNLSQTYKAREPRWRDLLTGDNGLDFSRCQMLIWTIIALFIFLSKCFYFFGALLSIPDIGSMQTLLTNGFEESKSTQDSSPPYLPYLPMSFIVLMGLSQGVYIGKKLVPTFKLDELRETKEDELRLTLQDVALKTQLLDSLVRENTSRAVTPIDQANLVNLQLELQRSQQEAEQLTRDIQEINRFS